MSKTPLAYLALKLVEGGKLALDRPLAEYLDEPYLVDQPLHKRITTRMVLSHTSGFPNWREGGWRKGGPPPVLLEPGTRFGYSGEGFLYLQRVVEHVTGVLFEEYVQRELFGPLAITVSSYVWQDRYEERWAEFLDGGSEFGFLPRHPDALAFAQEARVLLTRHRPTGIDVGVALGSLPFEEEAVARATAVQIEGVSVPLVTPELGNERSHARAWERDKN